MRGLGGVQGVEYENRLACLLISVTRTFVFLLRLLEAPPPPLGCDVDAVHTLRQLISSTAANVALASRPSRGWRCLPGYWVGLHRSAYR